jgi:hypothetical protein
MRSGVVLLIANLSVDPWLDTACSKNKMDTVGSVAAKVAGAVAALEVGESGVVNTDKNEVIGG